MHLEPLDQLFRFAVNIFKHAGRKLSSLECHDLVCKIAEIVVVGGVRRSALISLSNLSDDRMRAAKSGQWWEDNAQRTSQTIQRVTQKARNRHLHGRMEGTFTTRSLENGASSTVSLPKNRLVVTVDGIRLGFRHESLLRNHPKKQAVLCNLSEVVIRSTDTMATLKEKVRLATILGTFQSTLTNFKYLSNSWTKNTKEERLLGVSLTGIMDSTLTNGTDEGLEARLAELKEVAVKTNEEWSTKLGIPQSAAITCVKPSGTVSQLVDSASGIHARHNPYYIRTVRADKKDRWLSS